jgi:hypothetical protein
MQGYQQTDQSWRKFLAATSGIIGIGAGLVLALVSGDQSLRRLARYSGIIQVVQIQIYQRSMWMRLLLAVRILDA